MSAGASSAIPVSTELKSLFTRANTSTSVRAIIVQIDAMTFVERGELRSSVSVQRDFASMTSLARPPCYVLFRMGSAPQWLLISYVPDSASVHDRMLYASSKAPLITGLGQSYIVAEMQCAGPSDLTYSNYESLVVPSSAPKPYSPHELAHQEMLREEEAERSFRAEVRSGVKTGGSGIGGYHAVTIPFTPSARSALSSSPLVELAINGDQSAVDVTYQGAGDLAALKARLTTTDPRFYYLKQGVGRSFFIYCCPDSSPSKLRMVYSTAKPSVKQQIESATSSKPKSLEIRSVEDLTPDALSSSHVASYGYTRPATPTTTPKAKASSTVQAPHPIYNMISSAQGTSSPRATTKKIVIPPPGAY